MRAKYFKGAAEVYVELEDGKLLPLFNCSSAKITQSESKTLLANSMSIEGGNLASVTQLEDVSIELNANSIHKENLAFYLKGSYTAFTAGALTDEAHTVKLGTLVRLSKVGVTDVVVKNAAGTTTYVEGRDYVVKGAGLWIPLTSTITTDSVIHVSCDYPGSSAVQALTSGTKSMKVCIDGLNVADNGEACVIDIHKVNFGVADSLDFIGKDFMSVTIKGDILADTTKGSGESQYYVISSPEAA